MLTRRQSILGAASVALAPGALSIASEAALAAQGRTSGYQSGKLHVRRYGPALCNDGSRAIISGGAPIGAPRNDQHFYSSLLGLVEAITPATLEQEFLATAIYHRANHASVFVNGQVWLLGGRTREGTDGRLVSETERIDPGTQAIWRGPDLPVPLIHLSATMVGASVFVIGGVTRKPNEVGGKAVNQAWECAPPYNRWTPCAPMPLAVGNAAAIAVGERIYMLGGYDQRRAHAITQIYTPATDDWELGPPPPIPLSAHAAASANGRVFVFGDYTNQDSVLGLDTNSEEWRNLSVPFTPRRHVRATTVGDRIIVAGGNQSSRAPATDAVESFSVSLLNSEYDRATD